MGFKIRSAFWIAEACREFGWTDEHVLKMPARRFFAMLEAVRSMKASEKIDLCDIQFISQGTFKYYQELRKFFQRQVMQAQPTMPTEEKEEARILKGEEAKNAVISLFKNRR